VRKRGSRLSAENALAQELRSAAGRTIIRCNVAYRNLTLVADVAKQATSIRSDSQTACATTAGPDTPNTHVNAANVLAYPVTRLFVERAAASSHRLELSDQDAPIIAEMCRKLDDIALAIELAAARVGVHGRSDRRPYASDRTDW
jgi:hypothetical protein